MILARLDKGFGTCQESAMAQPSRQAAISAFLVFLLLLGYLWALSDWVLPSLSQITVFPTLDLGDLSGRSHQSGFTGIAEPHQTPTSFLGMGIYLCARCFLYEFLHSLVVSTRCVKALPLIVLGPRVAEGAILLLY